MDDLKSIIGKVATGATLSREEAASAFDSMMSGEATPSQMGGLLMALRVRGETVDEITGAVSAMRSKMLRVTAPLDTVDIVGTGGDGSGSLNVSTCASFIVAGAGVPNLSPALAGRQTGLPLCVLGPVCQSFFGRRPSAPAAIVVPRAAGVNKPLRAVSFGIVSETGRPDRPSPGGDSGREPFLGTICGASHTANVSAKSSVGWLWAYQSPRCCTW